MALQGILTLSADAGSVYSADSQDMHVPNASSFSDAFLWLVVPAST